MLKKALEEMSDAWAHWFAPDPISGKLLPSMLAVALAIVIVIVFGLIAIYCLGRLLKSVLMLLP
jgi:hypothetical protein